MQTTLGYLLAIALLLQIQVRYARSNSDGYYLEMAPTGFWDFLNALDLRNEFVRDQRSVPRSYENLTPSLRRSPIHQSEDASENGDSANPEAPHIVVRRAAEKLKNQTNPIPPPTEQPDDVEDGQFLQTYGLDLDKIAYNLAKYVRLSVTVVVEHFNCLFHIFQIIVRHGFTKLKLTLSNPLQLIFLPFSLPVDIFKFVVATGKFSTSLVKHLFSSS